MSDTENKSAEQNPVNESDTKIAYCESLVKDLCRIAEWIEGMFDEDNYISMTPYEMYCRIIEAAEVIEEYMKEGQNE